MAFADIIRKQRRGGSSVFSSLTSAATETVKEKIDPRNLLNQKGILTALFPGLRSYSASKTDAVRNRVSTSPSLVNKTNESVALMNEKLDFIGKNTMSLPLMMRDINVMRQSMIKLVKLQGGTQNDKADRFFRTSAEQERKYKENFSSKPTSVSSDTGNKENSKGVISKIFSAAGSMLGGVGSLLGGVIGIALSALGLKGIILAIVGVFLASKLMSGISFDGVGDIFKDVDTSIKKFLGLDTEENKDKNIFTIFSDKVGEVMRASEFGKKLIGLVDETMSYIEASFKILADTFMNVGDQIVAGIMKWFDDNRTLLFSMLGAVVGSRFGLKGAALGAAIGAGASEIEKALPVDIDKIKEEIKRKEDALGLTPGKPGFNLNSADRKRNEQQLEQLRENLRKAEASQSLRNPTPRNNSFDKYLEEARKKRAPAPTSGTAPSPVKGGPGLDLLNRIMDEEGITDPEIRNRIIALAQKESSMNPNAVGKMISNEKSMHFGDQAQGLLQIMPKTAEGMGFSKESLRNPETAARAGVRYFMQNYKKLGTLDAATVAHHAGPGRGQEFLNTGTVSTKDVATGLSTMDYLKRVQANQTAMSGGIIGARTTSLADARNEMSIAPPVIINNAPQTVNNMGGGSSSVVMASVVDEEFSRLLFERAII